MLLVQASAHAQVLKKFYFSFFLIYGTSKILSQNKAQKHGSNLQKNGITKLKWCWSIS